MTILLVTALAAEARPLRDRFRLKSLPVGTLQTYTGDRCLLVQTGIGKLPAAAAVAAVLARRSDIDAIINVGLCGSAAPLGTVRLAHTLVDAGSGRRWFSHLPPRRILPTIDSRRLETHDRPATAYTGDTLFDMEASGVRTAAARLDNTRVQFVKVVSDAPDTPLEGINAATAAELLSRALPVLEALFDWYETRCPEVPDDLALEALLETIRERVRPSVSEAHAIRRLLQRHRALLGRWPAPDSLDQFSASQLRKQLEAALTTHLPVY